MDNVDNLINVLNLIKDDNKSNREMGLQLLNNFEKDDYYLDYIIKYFIEINEIKYKIMIMKLIKNCLPGKNTNESDKLKNIEKIFNFINNVSKDNTIDFKWIKLNFSLFSQFLYSIKSNKKLTNIYNKLIISKFNELNVNDRGIYIILKFIKLVLINLYKNKSLEIISEYKIYLYRIIEKYFLKFEITELYNKSLNSLIKILYEILNSVDNQIIDIYFNFFINNYMINLYWRISENYNKLYTESGLKLFSKFSLLLKNIYKFINQKKFSEKYDDKGYLIFNKLIQNLINIVYQKLHNSINNDNFNITEIKDNFDSNNYYNYFLESLDFLCYFIKSNKEYFMKIAENFFTKILMNIIWILNNNNDLIDDQYEDFIKKHLWLLDYDNKKYKKMLIYKVFKIINIFIEYIDNSYFIIYNIIKNGIIEILIKNYNYNAIIDKAFIDNIPNYKWYSYNLKENFELYILILIYLSKYFNGEYNELELINLIISKFTSEILTSNELSLKLKFINFLIIYQNKIYNYINSSKNSNNINLSNNSFILILNLVNRENNYILNSFILRIFFKYIKHNMDNKDEILNIFFTKSINIIDSMYKEFDKKFYKIIDKIFIKNYEIINKKFKNADVIFEKITNMIIMKIQNLLIINQNNKIWNEIDILICSLVELSKEKNYVLLNEKNLLSYIDNSFKMIDKNKSLIWYYSFLEFLFNFSKNCNEKNNLNLILDFIIILYKNNTSFTYTIMIINEINKENKNTYLYSKNNDLIEFLLGNLKSNNIEIFTYFFINYVYYYNNLLNENIVNGIINNLLRNLKEPSSTINLLSLEKQYNDNPKETVFFIINILSINSCFYKYFSCQNYNIDILNLYEFIVNKIILNNFSLNLRKLVIISLIFILNTDYFDNNINLKNSLFTYVIVNLLNNYYNIELSEINSKDMSYDLQKLKLDLLFKIDYINDTYFKNKNSIFSTYIDDNDSISTYTSLKNDNIILENLWQNYWDNNDEYSMFTNLIWNNNYFKNLDKFQDLTNILIYIKKFKCEDCNLNKFRIIYDFN